MNHADELRERLGNLKSENKLRHAARGRRAPSGSLATDKQIKLLGTAPDR